ncbi:MAG: AMP-binding protein [Deltaproteobacteria bacterium]|nr:AMP-binding protein [Deltaproteobacteria bacterium]
MDYESTTLGGLLEKRTDQFSDKIYLLFKETGISYRKLNEKVNQAANGLLRLGVKNGTPVNLHLANCPEFLFAFFAAAKIGAIVTPTNLALTKGEVGFIVNHADAVLSITQPAFQDLIRSLKPECRNLEKIVVVGGERSDGESITWDDFVQNTSTTLNVPNLPEPDDVVVNMYTSGTTALPKGVMLTHQNILSAGHSWMWLVGFTPKDRTMTGFPLFHANALFFSCVGSLFCGGSLALLDKFSASNYLKLATYYQVTHFNFAGAAMALMLAQPEDPGDSNNPVRVIHNAMGPTEMIQKWVNRFKIRAVMIYNLTECALATGTPISGPHPIKLGSIGWPAPSLPFSTEVRVVNEKGEDTRPGVVGEIIIRGPALMKGYYKDPEKTAETIKNGWLYTGDGGYRDEDGCLWFHDRIKDTLKPKGENVASVEVEGVIAAHPKVADVGVIGVADPVMGEEIKASLVLVEGETAETVPPVEIIKWCEERLAKFKIPRFYEYRDRPVPRILGGAKISKKDLRKEKEDPRQGCYDARSGKWLK